MNPLQRRSLAAVLGTGLLLLLLVLATLDGRYLPEPPAAVTLREVQLYVPPPPPPPPPAMAARAPADSVRSSLNLSQTTLDALKIMELAVDFSAGELAGLGQGSGLDGAATGLDWSTVSLSELDGFPMVLKAPPFNYPAAADVARLSEYRVVFHIMVDEQGRTYPVRVVENPLPALNEALMDYAANVIFSPPLRLGLPVRAEYLWPVVFSRR